MAASHFTTTNYPSTHLVESAGGIVFSRQQRRRRMCILWHVARQEFLLPKGRRDHGESRAAAALREVREEAGVARLELLPVNLQSRTTPPPPQQTSLTAERGEREGEGGEEEKEEGAAGNARNDPNVPDEIRTFEASTEPFLCSVRELGDRKGRGKEIKLIWWFVMHASDEEGGLGDCAPAEDGFERRWMDVDEALATLTFKDDREVAGRAVELIKETYSPDQGRASL